MQPGARLGPYEIVALLGVGGMGEVYRARDTRLGRDVAIKVLPPDVAADAERLKRFEREAKATAALSHPNILDIHDVGSAPLSFRAGGEESRLNKTSPVFVHEIPRCPSGTLQAPFGVLKGARDDNHPAGDGSTAPPGP